MRFCESIREATRDSDRWAGCPESCEDELEKIEGLVEASEGVSVKETDKKKYLEAVQADLASLKEELI